MGLRAMVSRCLLTLAVCMVSLAPLQAQTPKGSPDPDGRALWIGEWTLTGTGKSAPEQPEYGLTCRLHGRLILGGHFVQIDQVWKASGPEQHALEILSYDPSNKSYNSQGFLGNGSTWVATATFDGRTYAEEGTTKTPDGKAVRFRCTWTFSPDRMAVDGAEEIEQGGARWTSFTVKGTRARVTAE